MTNQLVDQFILENLPGDFMTLHMSATRHFGEDCYRKVDGRLQSLRKRGFITFDRIKGKGTVWRLAA